MWIKTAALAESAIVKLINAGTFDEAAKAEPATDDDRFAKGIALVQLGRFDEARAMLEPLTADARLGLAAGLELALCDLRKVGGEAEAEARLQPAIEGADVLPVARARALHIRGLIAMRRIDQQQALRDLLEAAEAYQRLGQTEGTAQVFDTLGTAYAALGQIDAALSAYARSLADKTVLGDRQGVAITLGNLGRLSFQTGRYADARAYFDNDLKLARAMGDVRGEAKLLNDVGRVLAADGRTQEALTTLDEGLALAKARNLPGIVFFCLKDKAETLALSGKMDEALSVLTEARASLPAQGADFERLLLDLVEAQAVRASAPDKALQLCEAALQQLGYLDLPDLEVQARLLAAEIYRGKGQERDAGAALLLAIKRCRARGLSRHLRTLSEALTRAGIGEGVAEEAGRPIGWRADDALQGYFLRNELGSGAFGTVYRAFDLQRGRDVAIKVLRIEGVYDRALRETFLDSLRLEIEAGARVRHPGVAEVYAIGRDAEANPYIVQQFIAGRPLRHVLTEGAVKALPRIAAYMALICRAVDAMHRGGVVHRDLKPENVVITDAGAPVLIDFGISHVAGLKLPGFKGGAGTKGYAPPEQAGSTEADPKLDLYALGIMAWEWFSGARPEGGLAGVPDPAPKKSGLGGFFGGKKATLPPAETELHVLVRDMLAPANERLDSAEVAASRFDRIAKLAEAAPK